MPPIGLCNMADEAWDQSAQERALEIIEAECAYVDEFGCMFVDRSYTGGRPTLKHRGRKTTIAQALALPMKGQHTRHICGNEACVNPDHLMVGSPSENALDAYSHGVLERGWRHPRAVDLKPEQVMAIRADTRSQRDIAEAWGIAQSTVGQIRRGEGRWAEH